MAGGLEAEVVRLPLLPVLSGGEPDTADLRSICSRRRGQGGGDDDVPGRNFAGWP